MKSSEEAIYLSASDHGVAICDLPLSLTGKELFKTLRDACSQTEGFDGLSAIATGFWPIMTDRLSDMYGLPVPPQLWLDMVDPSEEPGTQ